MSRDEIFLQGKFSLLISAANFIAANSRALILDAQYNINKCEVSIPELKQELKEHNLKCKNELHKLNTRLKIVMGDWDFTQQEQLGFDMPKCKECCEELICVKFRIPFDRGSEARILGILAVVAYYGPDRSEKYYVFTLDSPISTGALLNKGRKEKASQVMNQETR